mgnify:CR=1 FL=1
MKAAQAAADQKPEDFDGKIKAAQDKITALKKLIADVAIYVSERAWNWSNAALALASFSFSSLSWARCSWPAAMATFEDNARLAELAARFNQDKQAFHACVLGEPCPTCRRLITEEAMAEVRTALAGNRPGPLRRSGR